MCDEFLIDLKHVGQSVAVHLLMDMTEHQSFCKFQAVEFKRGSGF